MKHRRTRRGGRPPPGLENFQGKLCYRASTGCSKILNVFNTVKNFRATLFFRVSASCAKILIAKSIFNTVKISGQTLFSGQAQIVKNPECKKYI